MAEGTGNPFDMPPPPPPLPLISSAKYALSQGFNTARPTFEPIRLHFAINHENYKEAEYWIKQGVDINFIIHGNTPLLLSLLRRRYDIAMLLIKSGADVTIPEEYPWKRQAIHLAAMCNKTEIVMALLNHGASIQAADGMQMTPLHWACSYGALETVRALLERGAHLETRDDRGKTPLFRAVAGNHDDVVMLLKEVGAHINVQDIYGWSPLHQAVFCSLPISSLLLRLKARPNLVDFRGNTALHLMTLRRDRESLAILARSDLQFYTRDRKITSSCTQAVKEFLDNKSLLYLLLDYGIDINIRNIHGFTAMDLAIRSGQLVFARWFVNAGAKVVLSTCNYPHGWPSDLLDDKEFCEFLCEKAAWHVQRLKELCRLSIRKYISPVISSNIGILPLPDQLKQYLLINLDA